MPTPRACGAITDNESLADCAEACPAALAEANGKLRKAEQEIKGKE